jgi:hypothetical protein
MARHVLFQASREEHQGLVAGPHPQGFVDAMQTTYIQCRHQPAWLASLTQAFGKQAEKTVTLGREGKERGRLAGPDPVEVWPGQRGMGARTGGPC